MTNQVNLLIVHYGEDWIRGSEVMLVELLDGLDTRYKRFLWTNNPSLAQQVASKGIHVEFTPFPTLCSLYPKKRKLDLGTAISLYQRGRALISEHNIDLIHVSSGAPCLWMTLVAHQSQTPILAHLHCPYPLHDRLTLGLHAVPTTLCVSQAAAKPLLDEGYSLQRMHIIHNGVTDPDLHSIPSMDIRAHLGLEPKAKVLLSVGSLIARKGFDRLITAISTLNQQGISHHLVIIGEGPERQNLVAFARAANVEHLVHLVGEQNNVPRWLRSGVDIFISGARSEAFGLVLVEAALAKLPIIAPSTGGIVEVIGHQHTGLLYPNDQQAIEKICQHVNCLSNNPVYALRLAIRARNHAKQHFSIEKNIEQIEHVYQQLLEAPLERRPLLSLAFLWLKPLKTVVQKHCLPRFFIQGSRYEKC